MSCGCVVGVGCVGIVMSGLDCGSCLDRSAVCVAAAKTSHQSWFCGSGFDHSVSV